MHDVVLFPRLSLGYFAIACGRRGVLFQQQSILKGDTPASTERERCYTDSSHAGTHVLSTLNPFDHIE